MSLLQRAILRRRVGRLVLEQVNGLDLIVLPDVFNPAVFRSSPLLVDAVASRVRTGERVLDIGTGTGVVAIQAAQAGADVVATDVNPEAIRCARINAILNHVEDHIDLRAGDLFAPVAGERFDVVVCNPPFFPGPPASRRDAAWRSDDFLDRFCAGLDAVIGDGGYGLIVFSNHADERTLLATLLQSWEVTIVNTRDHGDEVLTVYRLSRWDR